MYIDSEDVDHILQNLRKDMPKLGEKIVMMQTTINKSLRKISSVNPRFECSKWKNPQTKNQWEIHYLYHKHNAFQQIKFFPITIIERNGSKDYFLFYQEDLEKVLNFDGVLVKIFKGHFISRFKERTGYQDDVFYTIFNFQNSEKLTIVDYFEQNEKWKLYVNRFGIAFVKKFPLYLSFDTFITPNDLKGDQRKAIQDHIQKLYNLENFLFLKTLAEVDIWEKYIDIEKYDALRNQMNDLFEKAYEKEPHLMKDYINAYLNFKGRPLLK